jgi:DNA-binding response OmpR family regulator
MMAERCLDQRRILVVEDEYLLADELAYELEEAGAFVLGPVSNVTAALALLDGQTKVDGAVLDLNLGGEPGYPVADALIGRSVPLVLTTGYDARTLPERFADVPVCEKPIVLDRLIATLAHATRR